MIIGQHGIVLKHLFHFDASLLNQRKKLPAIVVLISLAKLYPPFEHFVNIDLIVANLLHYFVDGLLKLLGKFESSCAELILLLLLDCNYSLLLVPTHCLYHPLGEFSRLSFWPFHGLVWNYLVGIGDGL